MLVGRDDPARIGSPTPRSAAGRSPNKGHGCCGGRRSRPCPRTTAHDKIKNDYRRIAERRGRNIARVAAARKLLTLVYYGLRDGEIRCLAHSRDRVTLGRSQQTGSCIGMTLAVVYM